jgi:hypothetical protein
MPSLSSVFYAITVLVNGVNSAVFAPEATPGALVLNRAADLEALSTTLAQDGPVTFFQAFTGDVCDRGSGGLVSVRNKRCIPTNGRHSFQLGRVDYSQPSTLIRLYSERDCEGPSINRIVTNNECQIVDIGRAWKSVEVWAV